MKSGRAVMRDPRLWLRLTAALSVVGALLAPPVPAERLVFRLLAVVDITESMNVADAGPTHQRISRVAAARESIRALLHALPCGSELGIGLFTGHRSYPLFAPVEVCAHLDQIESVLPELDWRLAWAARSEVSKGLYASLEVAADFGSNTAVVFFSDGHEAPPLNRRYRPRPPSGTKVRGLVVGVGGDRLQPIPRLDRQGQLVGYWGPDEVLQTDTYSLGRAWSSQAGESMSGVDAAAAGGSGHEHLSWLHESHLRELAKGVGLRYVTLTGWESLRRAAMRPELGITRTVMVNPERRYGVLALCALVLALGWLPMAGLWRRWALPLRGRV